MWYSQVSIRVELEWSLSRGEDGARATDEEGRKDESVEGDDTGTARSAGAGLSSGGSTI